MKAVKAKKHLGQHFLTDESIAKQIVESLTLHKGYKQVLEIGAGTGVLTQFLIKKDSFETKIIDIDTESIDYLKQNFEINEKQIVEADFLKYPLQELFEEEGFAIIGNFPYNISSQIFFKVLNYKNQVPEIVCMLQKEVAERLASPPRQKAYGILSVLLQAYYKIEYLFTVQPEVFLPPPKVQSAVIRLKRNEVEKLDCNEKKFKMLIKQGFNNRRKTLRNALKPLLGERDRSFELLNKRAEELSVEDFVGLTKWFEE